MTFLLCTPPPNPHTPGGRRPVRPTERGFFDSVSIAKDHLHAPRDTSCSVAAASAHSFVSDVNQPNVIHAIRSTDRGGKKVCSPERPCCDGGKRGGTGGKEPGTKRFTDVYYDTADCSLTRRDTWLRERDGAWELKLPVYEDARRSGGERTAFTEVEGEAAVAAALRDLLPGIDEKMSAQPLSEMLNAARAAICGILHDALQMEARQREHRRRRGLVCHAVMEIEVLCKSESDVDEAEAEVARVADILGAQPLSGSMGGKLETYIRRHCPSVLAQLVEAGVLAADPEAPEQGP